MKIKNYLNFLSNDKWDIMTIVGAKGKIEDIDDFLARVNSFAINIK